jgi:hypothetical protein
MKYTVCTLVMALVSASALPISGFTQSADPTRNAVETGSRVQEIDPEQGFGFWLGDTSGIVYFTSEPEGLRVVATLENPQGSPVRFVATLANEQTATISVPCKMGLKSIEISFARRGDRVVVRSSESR